MRQSQIEKQGVGRLVVALSLAGCVGGPATEGGQAALADGDGAVSQPSQPGSGPGGSDYPHGRAERTDYPVQTSWGPMSYTVVEPADPRPASAPVLLYLMGNFSPLSSAQSQALYGAMEEHLARKGWVIIHPSNEFMSEDSRAPGTTVNDIDDILMEVTRVALRRQLLSGRVRPGTDLRGVQLAIGGHSAGGLYAQLIANQAAESGLPVPRALILHDPTPRGVATGVVNPEDPMAIEGLALPPTLARLPPSTYVLVIHGADTVYSTFLEDPTPLVEKYVHMHADSRKIFATVPDSRYSFLRYRRDAHGTPFVESTHLSVNGTTSALANEALEALANQLLFPSMPGALGSALRVDATDWYAFWKPTEAMLELAVRGRTANARYVFEGDTDVYVRDMGVWSDGVPVRQLDTKGDFGDSFNLASTLPEVPDAPGGVYLGGQPEADLGTATVNGPASSAYVFLANFFADPVRIQSIALEGDPTFQFPVAGPLSPDCDPEAPGRGWFCVITIGFAPAAAGEAEGELVVEYERNGALSTLRRPIRARGLLPD